MKTSDSKASTAAGGEDRSGVQVVRRSAQILNALRDHPTGLSLSQLATATGLARSTVHRLISALENERFVVSATPNGRYRLGPGISALAVSSERDFMLSYHAMLAELSRALNETVDLSILEGDHVRFLHQVTAPQQRLRAVSAVGASFPAYCTANGKALLSTISDERLERILPADLASLTRHTITTRNELLAQIGQIRRTHIAYDREEHSEGISAVGTTIMDPSGLVLAISVPIPTQRFAGHEQRSKDALLRVRQQFPPSVG